MNDALLERLLALYPALLALPAKLRQTTFAHHATQLRAEPGQVLFTEGQPCQGFPLVLDGAVRVAKTSPGGRSLELYRATPGEMCVISTTCLFAGAPLTAEGACTAPTELVLLSATGFDLLAAEPVFRRYAFGVLAERIAQLMSLVEAIAFQRLDQRLAAVLLGRGATVEATHQRLADEIGTVREIVTRLLKRFEAEGWLRLGRGRIELLDAPALRAFAAGLEGDRGH